MWSLKWHAMVTGSEDFSPPALQSKCTSRLWLCHRPVGQGSDFLKKTHLKRRFCQGPLQEIGGNRNYPRHFCQSRQEKADDIQPDSLIQNNHGLRSLQRCLLLAIQLGMFLDITIFKGTIHHHYLLRRPWPRRPNLLMQAIVAVARSHGSFEVRIRCCRNVVHSGKLT